jgi:hypothetical protein
MPRECTTSPQVQALAESNFSPTTAPPTVPEETSRGMVGRPEVLRGKAGDQLVSTLPMRLTRELLDRGQERYNIFCSPCHDRTGSGRGMVVRRGYQPPPSFHIERLRDAPVGHFFEVSTHGLGAMPDYAAQIPVEDRWAIAAYIKALQLSEWAPLADVPPDKRSVLSSPPPAPAPAPIERESGQESRNKPVVR